MKARFNKAGQVCESVCASWRNPQLLTPLQPQEGSQALVDNDYHEFPEMNQTSTAAHSQAAFRPPSIPDRNIAVPYPSPPAEKLSSPGDDEWAENLAKRASYEIDRVREDTRRRSKTMPEASMSTPWSPSPENYQLR